MQSIESEIMQIILEPKRKILIDKMISVVKGVEQRFIPEIPNPKYYEIWFYDSFDFDYVVLGKENFTIRIGLDKDYELLTSILKKYNLSSEIEEEKTNKIIQRMVFSFFSNCWKDIENILDRKIRCFLIEYGIIRGWDVNKCELIDGERIEDILNEEGIPYH